MVPLESLPLPRPLDRFGPAFPFALADLYVSAYAPRRGVVLDPLAHPWSAADAAERADRRGVARSRDPLGEWARRVVALAPAADEVLRALDRVGESALIGTPHRVAMRELYASTCAICRGPVIVEAFLWERDAPVPTKKAFRCGICAREGHALLIEATNAEDEKASQRLEPRGLSYWQFVERFGTDATAQALAESVAGLYTPRNLAALMATLRAIETTLPESPARDLLVLSALEVLVSGSRLNAPAAHGTPLRMEKNRARRSHAAQSREVNVWLEFDRTVRDLVAWLATHPSPARPRAGMLALDTGDADLVLCEAPVEDPLGGWTTVATAVLLGARHAKTPEIPEARASARERLIRTMRAALLDAQRASRPDAPAVVYVPQVDAETIAAVTLARAGGVSELEVFLDHFRSALADGPRAGVVKIELEGAAAEHAHDTTLYSLAEMADVTPLDDRLEWGIWGLLAASREVETRTLLRRAYGLFRDVETPDRELVERCNAAYGQQAEDGQWHLRDEDALIRRQADQTLLAAQLLDAGHRLGFKAHIGRDLERRALPDSFCERGSVLGDLQTDAERAIPVSRVSHAASDALES